MNFYLFFYQCFYHILFCAEAFLDLTAHFVIRLLLQDHIISFNYQWQWGEQAEKEKTK